MTPILPMVYHHEHFAKPQVLYIGDYKHYTFFVLNLGTHPTAYIRLPENHPFYAKNYEEANHYFTNSQARLSYAFDDTFTFSDSSVNFNSNLNRPVPDGWYIGFDRAHMGDWVGFLSDEVNIRAGYRKYTTEDMIQDCKFAIDCLSEVKL